MVGRLTANERLPASLISAPNNRTSVGIRNSPPATPRSEAITLLADIDADHGDRCFECLRHRVLLVFGAPCQHKKLAGQEHGRTIPLADLGPGRLFFGPAYGRDLTTHCMRSPAK